MTVMLKLLNLVRADHAYFGEKDYQQLKIISEMSRSSSFLQKLSRARPCEMSRDWR